MLRFEVWFNGNKILTTSGGGMVLSNDKMAIEKMRFWSTQAREPVIWYEHKEYGYNYRMSNICACIGRGQLEFMSQKLKARKAIHDAYRRELEDLPMHIKRAAEKGSTNHWLSLLCLDTDAITPAEVITRLQNAEIETRPAWKPMHMQPLFRDAVFFSHNAPGQPSVGETVFAHAVCLPSGDGMSEQELREVVGELRACFQGL